MSSNAETYENHSGFFSPDPFEGALEKWTSLIDRLTCGKAHMSIFLKQEKLVISRVQIEQSSNDNIQAKCPWQEEGRILIFFFSVFISAVRFQERFHFDCWVCGCAGTFSFKHVFLQSRMTHSFYIYSFYPNCCLSTHLTSLSYYHPLPYFHSVTSSQRTGWQHYGFSAIRAVN